MIEPKARLLEERVAVVTGAGGGSGRAIALTFAAHGARVAANDIDKARLEETAQAIRAQGGSVLGVPGDARQPADVARLAEAARREYGHPTILVNVVGDFLRPARPHQDTTEQDWQDLYDVNMKTVFLCCRAFIPGMIQVGKGGSIINFSTVEAFRAIPRMSVYSGTKAAICAFTRSLAIELAEHRIRVNDIAPDKTFGEQTGANYARLQREHGDMVPTWIPIGRFGQPDDQAGIALFLASDLSGFVTGATIHADGGTWAAGGWFKNAEGRWVNTPARP